MNALEMLNDGFKFEAWSVCNVIDLVIGVTTRSTYFQLVDKFGYTESWNWLTV